jgi:transposase
VTKRPKGATDVTIVTMIGNEERCNASSGIVVEVVLGVDTHLDVHLAVALDHLGRRLDTFRVPTTTKGYGSLLAWAEGFGPVRCAGVEGTSSYGAGLARYLRAAGIEVREVQRPKRRHRRRSGKSDLIDAEAAARAGKRPARQPESPRAATARWR